MAVLSVILHIDLDCFYAQVERERLKLPPDAEIAVVQWSMALAVSYPARKYGIKRGSNVDDIRRLGRNAVTIVPVETIGKHGEAPTTSRDPLKTRLTDVQAREKVSLSRYRTASAKVFGAIGNAVSGLNATVERASIDEAYIDVTAEVDRRIRAAGEQHHIPADTEIVGDKLDLNNESDARLAYGADIALSIRKRVFEECNYTMSAGISMNKLIAKFASAQNKPNKQTIVPLLAVSTLISGVPLRKLRGLGGKLGREVEALGVETAGEATILSMETLEKHLGSWKQADFVFKCVRGIDESEVVERESSKSLLAAKNFKSEMSLSTIEKQWLPLLAEEIAGRMDTDSEMNNRDAKTLTVSFRAKLVNRDAMGNASRSAPMPTVSAEKMSSAIEATGLAVLKNVMLKEKHFTFPINCIGLTATNFSDRANQNESISNYFTTTDKEAKSEVLSVKEAPSGVEKEEEYKRRLQARADREFALKLHREESSRGVKKVPKRSKQAKVGRGGTAKGSRATAGTMTMDMFFKAKNDSGNR